MDIQTEEIPKGNNVTLQILHDNLSGKDNNITVKDYLESDNELKGTYKIDGKEFGFTIDKNLNVKIGDVEKTIEEAFNMTVTNVDKTSLRATGDADKLNELGATEFTYVASTSGSNDIKYEHITTTSYDVTGLEPETEYTVYMLAYDNAGNVKKSNEVKVTTKKLEIVITDPYIGTSKTETDATKSVADNSQTRETPLYINFKATLEEINCTITLKGDTTPIILPYEVTANGKYAFVATGTYNGKTITKEIEVENIKYKVAKWLVQYDAGSWTKEEIEDLKSKNLYNINKAKTESSASDLNFTFGGFTYNGDTTNESDITSGNIITSRNQSVSPKNGYGEPYDSGWKVLEIKDNNGNIIYSEEEINKKIIKNEKIYVTKLIHVGSSENFSYKYTINNDEKRAEYILSGGMRQTVYDTYQPRNFDVYKDKTLNAKGYINNIHVMNYDEAINITGNTNKTYGDRNILSTYWLASSAPNKLMLVNKFGALLGEGTNVINYGCQGIRPVIEMNDGVYIAGGSGTETDLYILGKD